VRAPQSTRIPVGYDRSFLDDYRPNTTWYLTVDERVHLADIGLTGSPDEPAGTHGRRILSRLLIDLSWNSSRLEGNTYSLLDTQRLIELGERADGKSIVEAQMIVNHKDAIELLVDVAADLDINRQTILSLHARLSDNLLPDPAAVGRLRQMAVGITGSVFHPLEVPQLIEECFEQVLATARAIGDPFEQALFLLVQLPYLQPFEDVNKRVSRLAANIPLVRKNLSPLSFLDVPSDLYTEAILAVYELQDVTLLKELFIWAYERSAQRYAAIRQVLGAPDPFRMRYRDELRKTVATIITMNLGSGAAARYIADWATHHVSDEDRRQFVTMVETELLSLHEGNFARYAVRPAAFETWYETWRSRRDATGLTDGWGHSAPG
jgi:hypothetical protein